MTEYHKGENYVSEMHAVELMDGVVKGDLMVKQKKKEIKALKQEMDAIDKYAVKIQVANH